MILVIHYLKDTVCLSFICCAVFSSYTVDESRASSVVDEARVLSRPN